MQAGPVSMKPSAELTTYRLVTGGLHQHRQVREGAAGRGVAGAERRHGRDLGRDDGVGFDPTARRPSAHGLLGMRYRVEAEGGRFALESAPGSGTRIQATLPLAA
jgi:glucose-6-phosphate-specific signal transduction histidine kinase